VNKIIQENLSHIHIQWENYADLYFGQQAVDQSFYQEVLECLRIYVWSLCMMIRTLGHDSAPADRALSVMQFLGDKQVIAGKYFLFFRLISL
jgi:hypothetical protein